MSWLVEFVLQWIWEDLILAAHKKWGFKGSVAAFLVPVGLFSGAIALVFMVA